VNPPPEIDVPPAPHFDLATYLQGRRTEIDAALQAALAAAAFPEAKVVAAMRYSVEAGGKRLRPILVLAAAEAVGGNPRHALPAAVALELIHTYSLIHDDLPAMDNDTLRRGKPTCHVAFGEATAILAGDALLTQAFKVLADAGQLAPSTESHRWLTVVALLAGASGCDGMIEGQMRDLAAERVELSAPELESLHNLKTGALIGAAVVSGAILGGADPEQQTRLEAYARRIGLAFQVTDDILNVAGDPVRMGKAVGSDAQRGKSTYPRLVGLAESRRLADRLIEDALQELRAFDRKADPLRAIARYVTQRQR
jgi:geranylgeranyl diphosphate synthase type II